VKKWSLFVALLIGAVSVAPWASAAEPGVTDTSVTLGMSNAQTGNAAGLGKGMRLGAEAVFKEINAKGGIHGRKIKLLVEDDGYNPDRTVDTTLKLIEQDQVFSLFGFVGTPTSNAALPIVKDTRTPLVGLFSGSMALRQPLVREVFNVRASYNDETEVLVQKFINGGAKRFGVFFQDDGFGQAVLAGTEKALKKRGMEVVAKGAFERGTLAVQTGLSQLLQANPDLVIMAGPYAPVAAFVKAARGVGLKSQLATVSFVGTDDLVKALGNQGNGVVVSQVVPFPTDTKIPVVKECADLLAKHYPGEKLGFVSLEGAISAKVMALGLERAGGDLNRGVLLSSLEGLKDVDLGGLKISLSSTNHQASDAVFLTQIQDGAIAPIGL
jgi:ABC-type branched-subunit amino acid transport system substrate-binding protein